MSGQQNSLHRPKVGVFWVYQSKVLGQATSITKGSQSVLGLLDAEVTHQQVWKDKKHFSGEFPELADREYLDIPRGRVLYQTKNRQSLVYMDSNLMHPVTKQKIADFFEFRPAAAIWKHDLHYTTDQSALARIFRE